MIDDGSMRKKERGKQTSRKVVKAGIITANLALIALLMNLVTIPLLGPAYGVETTDRQPRLSWGGLHGRGVLMIDEDQGFGSPVTEEVSGNSYRPERPLDFGTYYWKVASGPGMVSATGMFTVVSEIAVEREGGWLKNSGNTEILLEKQIPVSSENLQHTPSITGLVVGINQSVELGREENVTAKQA